jgi:hypothetical protein
MFGLNTVLFTLKQTHLIIKLFLKVDLSGHWSSNQGKSGENRELHYKAESIEMEDPMYWIVCAVERRMFLESRRVFSRG